MKTWSGPFPINVTVYEPFSSYYSAQYFTSATVPKVRLCSHLFWPMWHETFSPCRVLSLWYRHKTETHRKCFMRVSHQTTVAPYRRWSVLVCTLLIAESLCKYLMKSNNSEMIFFFYSATSLFLETHQSLHQQPSLMTCVRETCLRRTSVSIIVTVDASIKVYGGLWGKHPLTHQTGPICNCISIVWKTKKKKKISHACRYSCFPSGSCQGIRS